MSGQDTASMLPRRRRRVHPVRSSHCSPSQAVRGTMPHSGPQACAPPSDFLPRASGKRKDGPWGYLAHSLLKADSTELGGRRFTSPNLIVAIAAETLGSTESFEGPAPPPADARLVFVSTSHYPHMTCSGQLREPPISDTRLFGSV
jgi:hypothetical protein